MHVHEIGTNAPYQLSLAVSLMPLPRTVRTPLDVYGSPATQSIGYFLWISPIGFLIQCSVSWRIPRRSLNVLSGDLFPFAMWLAFPDLGLLRELCYHVEYSEATLHSPKAFRFRQSTFSSLKTGAFCVVGWDFRHLPHLVDGLLWLSWDHICWTYDLHSTDVSISISSLRLIALTSDCPSGSLAFILIHKVSSRHSVVRWKFPNLCLYQHAIFPRCGFPSRLVVDDRLRLLPLW